jgi:hypothetical protein
MDEKDIMSNKDIIEIKVIMNITGITLTKESWTLETSCIKYQ